MNTTRSAEKSKSNADQKVDISNEISKIGVYSIAVAAGVIGCWAVIILVAGMINSGGPFQLLSNLVRAITG